MRFYLSKLAACALLTLSLVGALCSCTADKPSSAGTTSVTLYEVAHSIFYAPMYVAIEEGYFTEEGIALEVVNAGGADNVMTAMISGDADIGFMGSEASIYVYAEGSDDYAVNFAQLTQRAGNFLVAREPMDDFEWSDLIGSSVLGGRAGGMPEMVFEYVLKTNNIDPVSDLSIDQSISFGLTAAAFMAGEGDFTVEFEPFATQLEQEGAGYIVASLGVDSGYVPYTAFCAKTSYLEKNGDIVLAFTKAIQRGLDYVNAHSSEEIAAVIAPQFPETEEATVATIVERYRAQDTWKTDTIFTEEAFDLLQNILIDSGTLDSMVPYSDLVTTVYSEEALN